MKTSELIDEKLDWAVAKCWDVEVEYINDGITRCLLKVAPFTGIYAPSTDWSQGGPIIKREEITVCWQGATWVGSKFNIRVDGEYEFQNSGPTPLIAAMRCYVASKLGDEVDIPKELLGEQ